MSDVKAFRFPPNLCYPAALDDLGFEEDDAGGGEDDAPEGWLGRDLARDHLQCIVWVAADVFTVEVYDNAEGESCEAWRGLNRVDMLSRVADVGARYGFKEQSLPR